MTDDNRLSAEQSATKDLHRARENATTALVNWGLSDELTQTLVDPVASLGIVAIAQSETIKLLAKTVLDLLAMSKSPVEDAALLWSTDAETAIGAKYDAARERNEVRTRAKELAESWLSPNPPNPELT